MTSSLTLLDLSGDGEPIFPGDKIAVAELRCLVALRKGIPIDKAAKRLNIIEEKDNAHGVVEVAHFQDNMGGVW